MQTVVLGALALAVVTILILVLGEKHMQELKLQFTITIAPPPPPPLQVILPDGSTAQSEPVVNTLSAGQVGTAFDAALTVKGGVNPDTVTVSSGSLPDGLSLSAAADGTVHISGTPTNPGTFTFELDVQDSGQ